MTLTEKIIARACGRDEVRPGEEVWATADRMIMNDSSGPRRVAPLVEELGGLWDRSRVVLASDHFVPAATLRHAEIVRGARRWARDQAIGAFYEYQGILHNLVLQEWLARPGMLLIGADSHTVTAGAVGAVAVAVGSSELATVLASGQVWLRVPETIRVDLTGTLPDRVDMRDVTFVLLAARGSDWASYRALEYGGSLVNELDMDGRLVLANQGIEMGCKNAIVSPSARLRRAMADAGLDGAPPEADRGARYLERHHLHVSDVEPQVATPPSPDHGQPARALANIEIDRAWIGSCAGGRLSDLRHAAEVLRGRRTRVPLFVTPATHAVYDTCAADGTLATLVASGAVVLPPGCGACAGVHAGVAAPQERVIATATRNFRGRMGSPDAEIYLGSAWTVAASALAGRITDPRELS
jgi:3-isopropylmalate/(R)-2-methylmalate dehydratase large subunit